RTAGTRTTGKRAARKTRTDGVASERARRPAGTAVGKHAAVGGSGNDASAGKPNQSELGCKLRSSRPGCSSKAADDRRLLAVKAKRVTTTDHWCGRVGSRTRRRWSQYLSDVTTNDQPRRSHPNSDARCSTQS